MAEYVFAVRNCRAKHSTKATGDSENKAQLSPVHYASFSGTWGAGANTAVVAELKKKGRLKDPNSDLSTVVANAAAAGGSVAATTDTYQERVGKAVMQIGMGYDASDADAAKDGIVWLNLE
jgi:phosphoglycerate dehydrogenase-like enzyme